MLVEHVAVEAQLLGIDELVDVEAAWTARLGVAAAGALLLRPDGYVAWRARAGSDASRAELCEALARALCRPPRSLRARSAEAWRNPALASA